MKPPGGIKPFFGMPPADQRLGALDATGRDIHLRLVMQLELALRQCRAQAAFQLEPLAREGVHGGREELEGVAAFFLCVIHRRVGVL